MDHRWNPEHDWRDVDFIDNAQTLLERDIRRKKGGTLMFCSACDPYQPKEGIYRLSRGCLIQLMNTQFRVLVLTKSPLVKRDYDIISKSNNIEAGFTVTALEDDFIRAWEPFAPRVELRIAASKEAKQNWSGIKTFYSIEPWIPGITDPIAIMKETHEYVDWYILGRFNYHEKYVPKGFYEENLPEVIKFMEDQGIRYHIKDDLHCVLNTKKRKELEATIRRLGRPIF